jgi:fumarate hydratase subunit alpha/L(+)-tartrate dehydratase alpha subunit
VGSRNPDEKVAQLEEEMLTAVNSLEIGPQGLGGKTTSFALHIEYAATHISMNPVAVNIQCWRGERASAKISSTGSVTYGY